MNILLIILLLQSFNFYYCLKIKNNTIIWSNIDFNNNKNVKVLNNNTIKVKYKAHIADSGISKYFDLSELCNSLILEYKIYFPYYFDFVKGGKLPGLYGGDIQTGCTGCEHSDKCFSARLMWRKKGLGEIYLYSPNQKYIKVKKYDTNNCGLSLDRGFFSFYKNKWMNIKEEIKLNDLDNKNGIIKLWINNKLYIKNNNIEFKTKITKNVAGLFFSTFYGGDTNNWAPKKDTFALFSDFKYICHK